MTDQGHFFSLTPTPVKPATDHQVAEKQLRRAKILVVEDDIHLMEGVREILELDDYEVITASSGVEAMKVLHAEKQMPDLIVSDIMMPQMNGYEFFEAVRSEKNWISIPFIFLTARGEKADIRLGKAMGADDYVTKPFGAEDLLIAVNGKLERTKQLQSVFSTQISDIKRQILTMLNHEFRTPLTYVVAYSDMLNRDAETLHIEEMRTFLKGVSSGAERLRRLVENFIYLVELETGELQKSYNWRRKPLGDYEKIIQEALKSVEDALKERRQKVEIEVASTIPRALADREYVVVAVARLIDNASKFSPTDATIRVRAFADDDHRPTFSITDQGRGIPEDQLNHIFDSFYQIDRTQFEDQGAGSGLAIVRGIAQVHNAEITVQSALGNGSTFALHFQPVDNDNDMLN